MSLLDVVMIAAVVVAIWSVWSVWPLARELVADLSAPDMPPDDWEPVCPHVDATLYLRVGPFGLLCPECAQTAREVWMPRG